MTPVKNTVTNVITSCQCTNNAYYPIFNFTNYTNTICALCSSNIQVAHNSHCTQCSWNDQGYDRCVACDGSTATPWWLDQTG